MTTGISAPIGPRRFGGDRSRDEAVRTSLRPGHVFPLRAKKGGVLKRAGQTEASVDLAPIAGMTPAAVICEIMNEDGTMARLPDLASSPASTAWR